MKKIIFPIVLFCCIALLHNPLHAQTEKGKLYVGLGINDLNIWHAKQYLSFGFDASAGYFVHKNLVVGGRFGLGYAQLNSTYAPSDFRGYGIGVGPFARYYIPITQRFRIPIEMEAIAAKGIFKSDNNTFQNWSGRVGISTGLSFFVSKSVSIDAMIGYEVGGVHDEYNQFQKFGHLKGSIGLSIYLGGKKTEQSQQPTDNGSPKF